MMEVNSEWVGLAGSGLAWAVTIGLLVLGFLGCLIPILPGHLILLFAAIAHRLMLGREASGMEWWTFVVLGVLMVLSQIFEFAAGAAGVRWFGGTRWGACGAVVGGLVGMFFFPLGLILGPLVGAFAFEKFFAKQEFKPAASSGVGSVLGTVAGMGIRLVIGVAMLAWFVVDCFWIG